MFWYIFQKGSFWYFYESGESLHPTEKPLVKIELCHPLSLSWGEIPKIVLTFFGVWRTIYTQCTERYKVII